MAVIPTLQISLSHWCFFYLDDVNQADGHVLLACGALLERIGVVGLVAVKDASHVTAMERTVRAGVVDLQKGILTVNLDKRSLLRLMPSGFEQVAGWEFVHGKKIRAQKV
jgi:hypothetical protein